MFGAGRELLWAILHRDIPVESWGQFVTGNVQSLPSVKTPWVKAPRQTSVVESARTSAVIILKGLPLLRLVQVSALSGEHVKRETPGVATALALGTSVPHLAGIQLA